MAEPTTSADIRHREAFTKLAELIRDIHIAMLVTEDREGHLRSRPMAVQRAPFDGDLWFFTNESSPKVDEVARDQRVNVSFSDAHRQRYVSVSGTAGIVQDHAKMAELWHDDLRAWFPKGLQDPELALLRVSVHEAEYWDTPPSLVVKLGGFLKSAATGEQYDTGEHGRVELR